MICIQYIISKIILPIPILVLLKTKLTDRPLCAITEDGEKGTGSYAMAAHMTLQLYTQLCLSSILATAFSSN